MQSTSKKDTDTHMLVDRLDLQIIELLTESAQLTNKEIADRVGSTEITVANRIRDMEARNILRIVVQRDVKTLGLDLIALLDIYISQRSPEEVAEDLAQIEEAATVSVLLSDPDIFLLLHVRDHKHLLDVVENKVAAVKGISHWTANLSLEVVKLDLRYGTLGAGN